MKGAYMRACGSAKSERPLAHFFSGLICEGYCANVVWPDARIDKCCDAICNNTGFTTAGSCKNKQRAFYVKNSLPL
jgi:hypothetical protein